MKTFRTEHARSPNRRSNTHTQVHACARKPIYAFSEGGFIIWGVIVWRGGLLYGAVSSRPASSHGRGAIPPLSSMVPAHESVPQLHARMLALVKCRAADAPPDAPLGRRQPVWWPPRMECPGGQESEGKGFFLKKTLNHSPPLNNSPTQIIPPPPLRF